jgi:hypothetical protein
MCGNIVLTSRASSPVSRETDHGVTDTTDYEAASGRTDRFHVKPPYRDAREAIGGIVHSFATPATAFPRGNAE